MKRYFIVILFCLSQEMMAQTNPVISRFLQNTSVTARHYVSGNSTPINDASFVNCQSVKYSSANVYITTTGLPSYVTGPFLDGNPTLASNQNAIFKFPLSPVQNTGTPTSTSGGNIGICINGVALFDYRDGASWQNSTQSLKGGPYGGTGDGVWNRDAVVGELGGFDCSKGHPAQGNYHHHQNPSAFNMDLNVISNVCNLYNADGLYVIDSTQHSPLIGFAYDGFPIYGAYGYKNADGTGGVTRMKSSYSLRNITVRNTYANGTSVTAGPNVSTTYPLGYFKEDYQYIATTAATPDYLDEHNGRFCVTPEYPNGMYCYFATVKSNWNSAYPYIVGPTYYGVWANRKVTSITETVSTYTPTTAPSIYIAAYTKTICAGTSVSFTSATYNGGLNPSYQWKVNGSNVGTNSKFFTSSSLNQGDVVTCTITTASSLSATSNSIIMTVNPSPAVTIVGTSPLCSGTSTTLTANGALSYAWKNGPSTNVYAVTPLTTTTYTVTGTSATGCSSTSTYSIQVNNCVNTLDVKLFIEGYYNGSSTLKPVLYNSGIQSNLLSADGDTIKVELRQSTSPYSLADSYTGILHTNGHIQCNFYQAVTGVSYYVVVKHRSGMETWSANPVIINGSTTYDFSDQAGKAFGGNQTLLQNGIYGIFNGDINQDASVDVFDYLLLYSDINNGNSGYLSTDLNGDGVVDAFDYLVIQMNMFNGITVVKP